MFGIDVSKEVFDVAFYRQKQNNAYAQFPRTLTGYDQCIKWMYSRDKTMSHPVVMEHTGKLWIPLAAALDDAGRCISVLSSDVLTQGVRKMFGASHKTDKQDALVLAKYAQFLQQDDRLVPLKLPTVGHRQLKEMQRYVSSLVKTCSGLKMSVQQALDIEVKVEMQKEINHLEQRVLQLRARLAQMIKVNSEWSRIDALIQSIPGVGSNTSLVMITEVPDIHVFASAKQLASLAGLNPKQRQSGKYEGKSKLPNGGNRHIRQAMFMCTTSALRCNPMVQQMSQRLQGLDEDGKVVANKGLHKMQIRLALAHKIIRQIYGIWSSGLPFDPMYLEERNKRRNQSQKAS